MKARVVTTALMLTAWILWSPVALASHVGAGGRSMCAVDSSLTYDPALHKSSHDHNAMNETSMKLCSLGLCATFLSASESVQFRSSIETHVQQTPQTLLTALPQIPDPIPKSSHLFT